MTGCCSQQCSLNRDVHTHTHTHNKNLSYIRQWKRKSLKGVDLQMSPDVAVSALSLVWIHALPWTILVKTSASLLALFYSEQKPPFICVPEMNFSVKWLLSFEGPPLRSPLIKLTSPTFLRPSATSLLVSLHYFSATPLPLCYSPCRGASSWRSQLVWPVLPTEGARNMARSRKVMVVI